MSLRPKLDGPCRQSIIDDLTLKEARELFNENPCRELHYILIEVINRGYINEVHTEEELRQLELSRARVSPYEGCRDWNDYLLL